MKNFSTRFLRMLCAAGLAGSLAVAPALAGNKGFARDLSAEQAPMAEIGEGPEVSRSDLQVSAWLNRDDATYAIGERLSLYVRATEDAYITVLDVGTSGKVHILFPNRHQRDNFVPALEMVQIPDEDSRFRIRVNGPPGQEVLKVFATRKPLTLFETGRLLQEGPYYAAPGESRAVARDLSLELRERHGAEFAAATRILRILSEDDWNDASGPDDRYGDDWRGGDRRHGDRSFGDRSFGDRPFGDRHGDLEDDGGRGGERDFHRDRGDGRPEHGDLQRSDLDRGDANGGRGRPEPHSRRKARPGAVGEAEKLFRLGETAFYGESKGSIRDALDHYRRAADAGHTQAMLRIGQIHEQGYEVERDPVKALEWYRRAADLGNTQAMVKLARLYGKGEGVKADFDEAVGWLKKAAETGDGLAMAHLAKAYDQGRGLPKDSAESARFALNALRAGAWSAQNDFPNFSEATRLEIQKRLRDAGVYQGPVDGNIGAATRSALNTYARRG